MESVESLMRCWHSTPPPPGEGLGAGFISGVLEAVHLPSRPSEPS